MTLEELLRQGKSFGQGASNSAASTVTGPVDMLAWLLRKGGVNVGEAPIGGEAWMRQKGLMATPENRLAGLLGEGAGLAAPIVAAAKAPEIAGGLLQMGRNLAAPQTMNKQTGAIVYHGSPHKFDKFDSSKIGTGEGAQAYGHGLYFAESPGVAKGYKETLTNRWDKVFLKGQPIEDQMSDVAMALRDYNQKGGNFSQWKKQTAERMQGAAMNGPGAGRPDRAKELLDASNIIRNLTKADIQNTGSLYKVDLPDEHIAKMLDWDKPLSQQPQAFKDAVSAREQQRMMPILEQRRATLAGLPQGAENASILKKQIAILEDEITQPQAVPNMTGGEYFNYLRNREMAPAEQADWLRKAGIPGIRYLDGGSRSAGAGSSNFVVFPGNEGLLQILERNGKPIK